MEPLDLTKQPPRGPREALAGLPFLPRTIDKMRAALPGGNLGEYNDGHVGMSTTVLKRIGIEPADLQAVVASAKSESEVVDWVRKHGDVSAVQAVHEMVNIRMEDMEPERRQRVQTNYPIHKDVPSGVLADILEADDAALFSNRA